MSSKYSLYFRFPERNSVSNFFFPHKCHILHPNQPSHLDRSRCKIPEYFQNTIIFILLSLYPNQAQTSSLTFYYKSPPPCVLHLKGKTKFHTGTENRQNFSSLDLNHHIPFLWSSERNLLVPYLVQRFETFPCSW